MNFPPFPLKKEDLSAETTRFSYDSILPLKPEELKLALSIIDLTTLNPTDTVSRVSAFTQKVNTFKILFPELPPVAAICVYPNMVSVVKENLAVEGVKIAAVAGSFPSSMTFPEIKIAEAHQAVINGADEIDIVLPLWAFIEGNFEYCRHEIEMIKKAIGEAQLKVILESGVLGDPEKYGRHLFCPSKLALILSRLPQVKCPLQPHLKPQLSCVMP